MKNKTRNMILLTAGLVGLMTLTSCGGEVYRETDFTLNTYLSTKPSTWNTHDWETSDESYITSFTEMGLYDVILDENKTNYKFVTEMASEFPIKVTIGEENDDGSEPEHNIGANDIQRVRNDYYSGSNPAEGMIWDIKLNDKACWASDGKKINADDYVQSLERQLSPKYVNFRADSYYASNFVVANAERYFKSNRETIEPLYRYLDLKNGRYVFKDSKNEQTVGGYYYINFAKNAPLASDLFADGDSVTVYQLMSPDSYGMTISESAKNAARRVTESGQYYLLHYLDAELKQKSDFHDDWAKAETPNDVKSDMMNFDIPILNYDQKTVKVRKSSTSSWANDNDLEVYSSEKLKSDIKTFVREVYSKTASNAELTVLFGNIKNAEFSDFRKVGIEKIDDYTIRLYLAKAIKLLDLKFSLASNWLIRTDLYDKLTRVVGTLSTTEYASKSKDNYDSYGPYKLEKYEDGKSFFISRNDKWYGYTDGQHENQFQMTGVKTTIIEDHNTARGMFEKGELDDLTLDANDMKTYGNSKRMQTVFESYTQKISFNSDRAKLYGRQSGNNNKTILANDDFRKGLSLSLNRNDFAASTTAGSKAFTGLLNDLYLTDVAVGEMYTSTEQAQGIYGEVYSGLGGDPYSDTEPTDLAKNAQGYNIQQATYYVEKAIKTELESDAAGSLRDGNTIDIEFQVYDTDSDTTKNMTTFIRNSFTTVIDAAVKKYNANNNANISLKFNLNVVKNEDYYNSAKSGSYDMIFSIWGGAAINPYGLMQVYCDPEFESTCEFGFKGKQDRVSFDIDLNGDGNITAADETKTYYGWYKEIVDNIIEPDIEDIDRTAKDYYDNLGDEDKARVDNYNVIHNKRVTILAKLEAAILKRFEAIPLVARGSSSLYSLKIDYGTDTYINLVGYGGIRFMTFNYNDKAWHEFVTSDGYSANIYK